MYNRDKNSIHPKSDILIEGDELDNLVDFSFIPRQDDHDPILAVINLHGEVFLFEDFVRLQKIVPEEKLNYSFTRKQPEA